MNPAEILELSYRIYLGEAFAALVFPWLVLVLWRRWLPRWPQTFLAAAITIAVMAPVYGFTASLGGDAHATVAVLGNVVGFLVIWMLRDRTPARPDQPVKAPDARWKLLLAMLGSIASMIIISVLLNGPVGSLASLFGPSRTAAPDSAEDTSRTDSAPAGSESEALLATALRKAHAGKPDDQLALAILYLYGQHVEKNPSEAFRWMSKAAEGGLARAQANLGVMYEKGEGTTRDVAKAVFWTTKAAENGSALGQLNLGYLYSDGIGLPKNDSEAVRWFRKAAEQGMAVAQRDLAWAYQSGTGIRQDYEQAALWHLKAANQGDANAQFNLAVLYLSGRGVPKDEVKARDWFRKAADQGDAFAQNNLGRMYANGTTVPKDDQTAYFWFLLASVGGDKTIVANRDRIESKLTPEQRAEAQAKARDWRPNQ